MIDQRGGPQIIEDREMWGTDMSEGQVERSEIDPHMQSANFDILGVKMIQ